MSTLEIKRELHRFIDEGDDKLVNKFYELVKAHVLQLKKDRMIADGEEDVANGRTYSLNEARKLLGDWEGK